MLLLLPGQPSPNQTLNIASVARQPSPNQTLNIASVARATWTQSDIECCFCCQGNLDPIRKLMVQMEYNGVEPTLQSYAACLECLGRQKLFTADIVSRILTDIHSAVSTKHSVLETSIHFNSTATLLCFVCHLCRKLRTLYRCLHECWYQTLSQFTFEK